MASEIKTKGKSSFPGGVHPPERKELTEKTPIEPGPAVKQVTVLLSQHIGAGCEPTVKKGDEVKTGQKIGDSAAFISAAVHSPVSGKVKEISLQPHAVLGRGLGIVIDADTENSRPKQPNSNRFYKDFGADKYSEQEIRDAVRGSGIVGMGGAGFPTSVKIEPDVKKPKEMMIINGCECEPYITCDYRLMLEWTDQVIAGAKLARKASGCQKVLIAIEDNKPEAIEVMADALRRDKQSDSMEVVCVRTKYPQGGERQLINSVLSKHVPTGGIPPMIGVVVLNVATVAAIAEAVVCGEPSTHRVVTVTGEAVDKPGNFYVPIGTRVGELIDFCGGVTEKAAKVVLGGPMMGIAIADLTTPVTKTTNSITILTKDQIGKAKFQKRTTPCICCGRCIEACPEHLNPTRIAHAVKYDLLDLAESYYMSACIECGCCSYVCPANIELAGLIKTGKILKARQKKRMPD